MSKKVRNLFDEKSQDWDKKYKGGALDDRLKSFAELVSKYSNESESLLDLGCGSGIFSHYFNSKGFDVTGVDISQGMIDHCLKKDYQYSDKIKYKAGSLYDIHHQLEIYNNVVCSSVLEYVDDAHLFMELIFKLMSEKGKLYITIPNKDSSVRKQEAFLKKISWVFRPFSFSTKIRNYLTYLDVSKNRYKLAEFKSFAKSIGFTSVYHSFFNPTDGNNELSTSSLIIFVLEK